jgi:hypothetical protein
MTSKRGQCSNQHSVSYETRLSEDIWERTYFTIFWKSWNWTSYCRKWLLMYIQTINVRVVVLPIVDVKTHWNTTLQLLGQAYWCPEYTHECLHKWQSSDSRPLLTTQGEWTIVKYVMEVLRPFHYCILCLSKRHIVTLHHVITVDNGIFNHMDGVLQVLAKRKTQ